MEFPIRLNKYLAELGVASRREADTLIAEGKVIVNGRPAEIGMQINDGDDVIVRGATKDKRYLAYYKGRGIITHSPEADETDVAFKLREDHNITGVSPVGRLDKDSEGLLILSNDGRITGPLLDPEAEHEKEYDVTVDKPVNNWFLRHMRQGVNIEGYTTKPAAVRAHPKNKNRFFITLTEGKKHQIRRMCAALGYQVRGLKRVRVLNIELGKLKPNQYRKIEGKELAEFLAALNIK